MFIRDIKVGVISNSRKEHTLGIELITYEGKFTCSAPSGKSKGKNEVPSYNRHGMIRSVKLARAFAKKLIHKNFILKKLDDVKQLTELMESFEKHYGAFGANTKYVFEGVFLKAAAKDRNRELWEFINDDVNNGRKPKMPMPVGNCIGGGLHSPKIKGKRPDFQEFLLIPNEKKFSHAVTLNIKAYTFARKILKISKSNDESAWTTTKTNEEVLEILKKVAKQYKLRIGLDVAASTFFKKGYYNYKNKELIRDKVDQADYMERLIKKFGIFYVEDPMEESDFSGFKEIINNVNKKTLIVGDDLTTTNLKSVRRAVASSAINAVIIKPNQIGPILEVKKVVEYCKKNKIKMIFSHRSGETMDDILADYCIGFGGNFIKTGIYGRHRLIKLKRIMDIEKSLVK